MNRNPTARPRAVDGAHGSKESNGAGLVIIGMMTIAVGLWLIYYAAGAPQTAYARLSRYQSDCGSVIIAAKTAEAMRAKDHGQAYQAYVKSHANDPCQVELITGRFCVAYGSPHGRYHFLRFADKMSRQKQYLVGGGEPKPFDDFPRGPVILEW